MNKLKITTVLSPLILIIVLVVLSYNNVVFLRRSLNPVLLIPPRDIQLSTGYADISGTPDDKHGWHVDLANPAYLEWPVNVFIGKSLKAGYIPLVMPYQSLGVPLIGQYCHRVLSPYQMIENLFFPYGYDLFLILRLILAGIFTYLFIHPLCRRRVSALLAAVGYGLGSIMVIYSNHEEVSNVAMLLPLLIWAVRAFFDRPGLTLGCWLALALALVHTAGQPEIQLYLLFLALLYGLTRLFTLPARSRKAALSYSLFAIFLSAVIASPQIILFLQFHHEAWTYHPPGGSLGVQSPMNIYNFIFAFFPKLRQTPYPWSYRTVNLLWDWIGGYFSLGILVLAAAAARRPHRNRREILLFGLYFLFILAKNLGWSPAQLLGLIPLFDQTWSPRWAAATWSFALAVLAGFGLDNFLDRSHPIKRSPFDGVKSAALKQSREFTSVWPVLVSPHPGGAPGSPLLHSIGKPPKQAPLASARKTPVQKRLITLLNNPRACSTILFITIILAFIFWWQGRIQWEERDLRKYILFNGSLFFIVAAGAALGYRILSLPAREYLGKIIQRIRYALVHKQITMIAILSAVAFAAERWIPIEHYSFSQPVPLTSCLFAAPVLLAALFGLFYMAASPSHLGSVIFSAIAIPTVLLGGWANLPGDDMMTVYWVIFSLAIIAFLIFPRWPRIQQVILPLLYLPLFCGLVALALTTTFFSPEADQMVRYHYYCAIFILAIFSGLSWWNSRGGTGCGWFFLIMVWMELTIYIPKNHGDQYLLIDTIPFLIGAVTILGLALWFQRASLSPNRQMIYLLATIILCAGGLFVIEVNSTKQLPENCAPADPLPFVKYLQNKNPAAVVGIGRVLSPNFASAHGLSDLRGCVSMNTNGYQFFLGNILQVVPRSSSYSLWFTGDNPIKTDLAKPYGSSESEHLQAFKRAFPFYILSSTRYLLCHPGILDKIEDSLRRVMKKIYAREIDIWELPSLPPAYIAHKAAVISMLSDTWRWGTTVGTDEEVLRGNRVILEEDPPRQILESERNPTDRAELIMGENPNRMKVIFHSEKPGYLVISRSYTNLLRAYIDGEELPILKANGPFMAVPVPGSPKDRVLKLSYLSPTTKLSFALSILGILMVLAGLVLGRKKN